MRFNKPFLAHTLALCLGTVLLGAAAPDSFASGSTAVGSAQTGERAAYQRGKRLYQLKLGCDGCRFDGQSLNKKTAMSLTSGNDPLEELTADEKADLSVYLKRRFKL